MDRNWEDKIVVFEKNPASLVPGPSKVSNAIKLHIEDYICHSTRVYRTRESMLLATEVNLKRNEPLDVVISIEEPVMPGTYLIEDRADIKQATGAVHDEMSASYMIYDRRYLFVESQRGTYKDHALYGELLLQENGKLFRFKDVEFPMTRALYGVANDASEKVEVDGIPSFSVVIDSEFKQSRSFRQAESSRIVTPGMRIADIFDLRLVINWNCRRDLAIPNLVIKRVKIELHELTWSITTNGELKGLRPAKRFLHKRIILDRVCKKAIRGFLSLSSEGGFKLKLPASLYNCKLPQIQPTLFSNGLSRTFGLNFIIELALEDALRPIQVSAFLEISVARRHDALMPFCFPSRPKHRDFLPRLRHVTVLEKFNRDQFEPDLIAKKQMDMILGDKSVSYRSHQSDSFPSGDNVYVMSMIDFTCHRSHESERRSVFPDFLGTDLVTHFGRGPVLREGQQFVMCEVVSSSIVDGEENKNMLIGGLFFEADGRRIRYAFPFGSPLYPYSSRHDLRVCSSLVPLGMGTFMPLELTLKCRFRPPPGFNQRLGDKVVLPSMRVPSFLVLELQLPVSIHKVKSDKVGDLEFKLAKVQVKICETIGWNCHALELASMSSKSILCRNTNRIYRWSDFENSTPHGMVYKVIEADVYDCSLPYLGPTIFSYAVHRSYEVSVDLLIDCLSTPMTLSVSQKVKVAATDRDCPRAKFDWLCEDLATPINQEQASPPPYAAGN